MPRDYETRRDASGRRLKTAGVPVLVAAVILAGCSASLPSPLSMGGLATGSTGDTGSFASNAETGRAEVTAKGGANGPAGALAASTEPVKGASVAELAKAHGANPADPQVALGYARALKRAGKRHEALAVLDTAVEASPKHHGVRLEHGFAALELGQAAKAEVSLQVASAGAARDWRVHSGLGVAASSLGRQKDAQGHFARALELSPDNGAVLNNMAVSLLLDRKMDQAETLLRRAARGGQPRQQVAQNLALARALKSEAGQGDDTTSQ